MIIITSTLSIDENELHFNFIRSSGPGGQNVNKASTAVQLRFDVVNSPTLPEDVKKRLIQISGKKMTEKGILIIDSRRHQQPQLPYEQSPYRDLLVCQIR